MDYFLPKPIRRPALKQVLKRYCPTIPEAEESEKTPEKEKPERTSYGNKSPDPPTNGAAQVMTNGASRAALVNGSSCETADGDAVSPLS